MTESPTDESVLNPLFALSSFANIMAGLTLLGMVLIGVTAYPGHRFPPVAIIVGCVLLVQGMYGASYALGWWSDWGEVAQGALFATEWIAGLFALATLWYAVFLNARASNGGVEPAPVLAGAMIGANALLALALLGSAGALTPRKRARGAA